MKKNRKDTRQSKTNEAQVSFPKKTVLEEKARFAENGTKGRGKTFLLKHLSGQRLTARQCIIAHCYECLGYQRGNDCKNLACALYQYMPARDKNIIFKK